MKYRPTEKKTDADESMVPYFGSYLSKYEAGFASKVCSFWLQGVVP